MIDTPAYQERWRCTHGQEASRRLLREVAHDMMRKDGVAAFNMRALGARIGISTMAAYRYYPGKDTLIQDVRMHVRAQFGLYLRDRASGIADGKARFMALCEGYLAYALANRTDYDLMFGASGSEPPPMSFLAAEELAWRLLNDAISALPGRTRAVAPHDQAHLVWATLHGLVVLAHSGKLVLGRSVQQLMAAIGSFLLQALGTGDEL